MCIADSKCIGVAGLGNVCVTNVEDTCKASREPGSRMAQRVAQSTSFAMAADMA